LLKGKVIEIGCFNGFFVAKMVDNGVDAFGIDINTKAIELGMKRFNFRDRLSTEFNEKFDTAILIDVLEHIEEPVAFVESLVSRYNLNRVIISCPNSERIFKDKSDWPPHHYWRFSRSSFEKVMTQLNFKESSVVYETSMLLLFRNIIGRLLFGYSKKWFVGAPVYSVNTKFRGAYNLLDRILSAPMRLLGFKYASIMAVYEKK